MVVALRCPQSIESCLDVLSFRAIGCKLAALPHMFSARHILFNGLRPCRDLYSTDRRRHLCWIILCVALNVADCACVFCLLLSKIFYLEPLALMTLYLHHAPSSRESACRWLIRRCGHKVGNPPCRLLYVRFLLNV